MIAKDKTRVVQVHCENVLNFANDLREIWKDLFAILCELFGTFVAIGDQNERSIAKDRHCEDMTLCQYAREYL